MKSAILGDADDILARLEFGPLRGIRSRTGSGLPKRSKLRLGRPLAIAARSHSLELSKRSELRQGKAISNCLEFQNLFHEHLNLCRDAETDDSDAGPTPAF